MGRAWTTDGRNAQYGVNHGEGLCCFFHQFFGSPTTLPSLILRMCHAAASSTSWVVKVPGTTSTPASIMLRNGPARTTTSCGRWRAFVTPPVSPPITSGCSRVRATAAPIPRRSDFRNPQHPHGAADRYAGARHLRHDFIGAGHIGQNQGQLRNPDNPNHILESAAPTRSATIVTHIAATGIWLSCRRACLPRAASTASSCA